MRMEIIGLTCPNCGGYLKQAAQSDRWKYAHCGTEHVLQQASASQEPAPIPHKTKPNTARAPVN